jgi:thymidylate synthase ThyX
MQQSTRFISLTDPSKHEVVLHKDVTFDALFIGSCERAFSDYTTAIDLGKPKEIARDLLPLACATSLYMKTNLSSWKHIIDLRFHGTTGKPHPMISELMGKILEKLREDHSKIATILEGK